MHTGYGNSLLIQSQNCTLHPVHGFMMVLKHVANMICYSVAGDSGTSPKASGSETVKDAGSKVASAVTDAGECSLAMWSIPILALQQILWPAETSLHGGMLFVALLQICFVALVNLCEHACCR